MQYKISLIGAGNIGGTLAHLMSIRGVGDIVLYDTKDDLAEGKALDISQSGSLLGFSNSVLGTADINQIEGSDAIVITAGLARKPGMQRDELVKTNLEIIKNISSQIKILAPSAFVIIVTNPLDTMAWAAWKFSGLDHRKVVGMAGALDTARYRFFLAQALGVDPSNISSMVLGGHGDTMVTIESCTSVAGIPLKQIIASGRISRDKLDKINERTRNGGAEIVALLKAGSAFYSPAASVISMIESYLFNQKKIIPCAVMAKGHYGINEDIYVGLPVIIGSEGVEVVELALEKNEKSMLDESINKVKELINSIR